MSARFHFINVGPGNTTFVEFPNRTVRGSGLKKSERLMMVDINRQEGFTDPIEYYLDHFGKERHLFRFVCTHPHKDHISGLDELVNKSGIEIVNFWDTENDFYPEDWVNDPSPEDWKVYTEIHKGNCNFKVLTYTAESTPSLYWNDDEDKIQILSPTKELIRQAHTRENGEKRKGEDVKLNEMPYVLLIRINSIKVLLTSDAEGKCLESLLENFTDEVSNLDILQAPHHGHESGFNEDLVKIMNPKFIVFSNSEEMDDKCGVDDEYLRVCPDAVIYKTHEGGNLIAECDYESGAISWLKNN